jgi:hypothetical protein
MKAGSKFDQFSRVFGLHPFVGFGMFAVDWMLFSADLAVGSWLVTIPVGLALSIPCVLIQKYGMRESFGLAVGKGVMIGIITAIPTALPSVIPFIGGAVGGARIALISKALKGDSAT